MSLQKKKIGVLTILYDNLRNAPPQLVPSTELASQLNLSLPELRQLLRSMEGMGIIETDPDLQFNLITRKGLSWLNQQNPEVTPSL